MGVVNLRLDRWEQLIRGQARGGTKLVLFPEFALQGFPVGESAAASGRAAVAEIAAVACKTCRRFKRVFVMLSPIGKNARNSIKMS